MRTSRADMGKSGQTIDSAPSLLIPVATPERTIVDLSSRLSELDLGRLLLIFLAIRSEEFRPLLLSVVPALADSSCEVIVHAIRDEELRVLRPPIGAFDETDFIVSERFAMRR